MPPIDPFELLKCLGVLLTPMGGIKSPNEVDRISRLMLRFSKKLVSKCIYIQILKTTHPELLQMFLNKEGWSLLDAWLTDGVKSDNKALLNEMLQLLAVCPLEDVEVKQTNIPQTIQSLAQGNVDPVVRESAAHLWSRCYGSKPQMFSSHDTGLPEDIDLSIYAPDASAASSGDLYNPVDVSMTNMNYAQYGDMYSVPDTGDTSSMMAISDSSSGLPATSVTHNFASTNSTDELSHTVSTAAPIVPQVPSLPTQAQVTPPPEMITVPEAVTAAVTPDSSKTASKATPVAPSSGLPVIKIVTKGGMPYVVKKEAGSEADKSIKESSETKEKVKIKEKEKKRDKEKEKEVKKSSSSSKSKSSSSSSKDSKTKEKEKKDKDESRSKEKSKEKSKSSKEDKEKDKEKKAKHEAVAKQAEKDRETLAALKAMTSGGVAKLSKIPRKKAEDKEKEKDKPSSESAQPLDILDKLQRPKTVKTFNSKFRSTGLEETTKPATKKPAGPTSPAPATEKKLKRPGLPDAGTSPTEKKPKVAPEKDDSAISAAVAAVMKKTAADTKPAVKLISPRPRPLLQDSSLFMDALEAGSKLEPRKRKRRASSGGKDAPSTPDQVKTETAAESPAPVPAPPSPTLTKPTFKFYQDTLETEENGKDKEEAEAESKKEEEKVKEEPQDEEEETEKEMEEESKLEEEDEVKKENEEDGKTTEGVLVTHVKKKPKKTVRWRSDDELHSYHYFELDENERVNVNKLKFGDMMQAEKQNERQAFQMAKTYVDEEAEEKPWVLYPIDLPPPLMVPGAQSRERDIQEARENSTLQALYFKGQILPDYPAEPDPEVPLERTTDPQVMPLDDVTGNPESVYDLRHIPWPEPRIPGQYHPPAAKPYVPVGPDMHQQDYMGPPRNRGYLGENGPPQPHMGPMNRPGMGGGGGGGGWFTSDGSVFPEPDGGRYGMGGPVRPGPYDYDTMGPGPGYRGPGRGMGMDVPRPRFPGAPPRGPPRSQGPRGGMQPCWHFMRGFCRLENRCKFLHPGFSGPMA